MLMFNMAGSNDLKWGALSHIVLLQTTRPRPLFLLSLSVSSVNLPPEQTKTLDRACISRSYCLTNQRLLIEILMSHLLRLRNKVTTRWEGPQSLSYHKQWLAKMGYCIFKLIHANSHTQQEYKLIVLFRSLYVWPLYQHSPDHKSNCQKVSPSFHPDLAPVCMTHIPALTPP